MTKIAIVGVPLAGKTALMTLMEAATGAPLVWVPAVVPSGMLQGARITQYHLQIRQESGHEIHLATNPAGSPVEIVIPLVQKADLVVFVFDCRSTRAEDQRRLWRALQPHWGAGPAAYVINRRQEADVPSDEVLRSAGADPSRPCIELSLGEENEAPRLRDFIVALSGAAV